MPRAKYGPGRISVKEAADRLCVSQEFVRLAMQQGILPIGTVIKMSSIYTYHISPKLLDKYLGEVHAESPPQDKE